MESSKPIPSRRIVPALALSLVLGGLASPVAGQDEILRGDLPPMPAPTFHPSPEGIEVTTFVSGLQVVWALEFAPDGRLFLTERPGRVRVVSADGTLEPEPWATFTVHHEGESGLMGLALHPDFPVEPWVYVMYTTPVGDGLENRVSRIREVAGRGAEEEILLSGIPATGNHSGGTLLFGPDGMLYVATGDVFERERSADLDDLAGKILRLTPEGTVPEDNPFPGSPVFAYGVRNPHGFAFHGSTGRFFAADHGPTGEDGTRAHDRVLEIQEGRHHGWPAVIGAPGLPEFVDPFLTFVPSNPPGDVIFYEADLMPQLRGDLFVSVLGFTAQGAQTLLRVRFDDPDNPGEVVALERWFNAGDGTSVYGRLRGLTVGPDGAIYVGTSNFDGRLFGAQPREGDDRVLRIAPPGSD